MDDLLKSAVIVATGIITIAIIATIVSKNADTSNVIKSAGSALSGVVKAAVSPVSGGIGSVGNSLFGGGTLGSF